MASATTASSQIFQNHNTNTSVSRHEIQAAVAEAVELRALHAALKKGNSPANSRYPSSPPVSLPVSLFSAQDYPVFTPSYDDEPAPGYHPVLSKNPSRTWDDYRLEGNESGFLDYKKNSTSQKRFPSDFATLESHICPAEDRKSVTGSTSKHIKVFQNSPGATEFYRLRRGNSLGDFKSVSSCNRCKPATITTEPQNVTRNIKKSNIVVPLTDSHSSVHSQSKNRGVISWLFPRLKKKHKWENSPNRTKSEEVSQIFKDLGILSVETLKRELIKANESRDAALNEVAEMKPSFEELKQRLEYLESYCEELKKALRQATNLKGSQYPENPGSFPWRGRSTDGNSENLMPVSEEVMVEGFLQIVSEARLSVKQFCKTLITQIEDTDQSLMDNLNSLLQPYKLSLTSKFSKAFSYHLEAIINQTLYMDFENCMFQEKGTPKHLDRQQDRQVQFSSFVSLRNLSWNEVLRKGTKYYSEEFSKFCDQKMSCVITTLNWTRPWPEQLLQAFFVAAKCIWLLHLLAFSFNPPLGILRVEENRSFDGHYMEDLFMERQISLRPSRVKIMVTPGFYVQDRVLRCKVLCKNKSAA